MRVSIFQQGETVFSSLSIYLQRSLFLTLAVIPLMLLWILSTLLLAMEYFYITPCEIMAWRIAKQINFNVPTFMNVLAAKHAELTLSYIFIVRFPVRVLSLVCGRSGFIVPTPTSCNYESQFLYVKY